MREPSKFLIPLTVMMLVILYGGKHVVCILDRVAQAVEEFFYVSLKVLHTFSEKNMPHSMFCNLFNSGFMCSSWIVCSFNFCCVIYLFSLVLYIHKKEQKIDFPMPAHILTLKLLKLTIRLFCTSFSSNVIWYFCVLRFGYDYAGGYERELGGRPGFGDERPHGRYMGRSGGFQGGPSGKCFQTATVRGYDLF